VYKEWPQVWSQRSSNKPASSDYSDWKSITELLLVIYLWIDRDFGDFVATGFVSM